MKNQYFGDVNDFRKYGLLRCVAAATHLPIGVLWMLTEDDNRTDGEFRRYLQEAKKWRHHDEELHTALVQLLAPDVARDVDHAQRWNLIPRASYFNQVVIDSRGHREQLMADAAAQLAHCPLLFLDPDNGLEVKSVGYGRKGSSKYVYWSELETLFRRGHSLLVYQHYRRVRREVFEAALIEEFRSRLGAAEVAVFSTPHVVFVLALQDEHRAHLPRVRSFVGARWGGQIAMGSHRQIEATRLRRE